MNTENLWDEHGVTSTEDDISLADIRERLKKSREDTLANRIVIPEPEMTENIANDEVVEPESLVSDPTHEVRPTTSSDQTVQTKTVPNSADNAPKLRRVRGKHKPKRAVTLLDRVMDEQFKSVYEMYESEAEIFHADMPSRRELGDVVAQWLTKDRQNQLPSSPSVYPELPIILMVHPNVENVPVEMIEEFARKVGDRWLEPYVSVNFLERYGSDELTGRTDDAQYRLGFMSRETSPPGNAKRQREELAEEVLKNDWTTASPNVIDGLAYIGMLSLLGKELTYENTYVRDIGAEERRLYGLVRCVPSVCVTSHGQVRVEPSPINTGRPFRKKNTWEIPSE